jgi:hypothetical protein
MSFLFTCFTLLTGCLTDSDRAQGWAIALEMTSAGGVAGALGGLVGSLIDRPGTERPRDDISVPPSHDEGILRKP